MKCIFALNSKASMSEPAEEKHERLIKFLKTLDNPWKIDEDIDIPFPGFGKEFIAISKMNKFLTNGIKMSAFYRYRNRLEDHDSCDDWIYIEFNSDKINYAELVDNVFPQFVIGYNAYTGYIKDERLTRHDFEEKRFGNKRKKILRVYPVSFYNSELCELNFKRSPSKIVKLLANKYHRVEIINGGVLIVADTKPISIEESVVFEQTIYSLLR